MKLLERIRRFWGPAPSPDHPLDQREREAERSSSANDENARSLESIAGDDFDPDDGHQA